MPTAQDLALLALAHRRGHLAQGSRTRAAGLGAEVDRRGVPVAHLLLARGLLPAGRVAALLQELAQGSFACDRCAERLPYFGLAGLSDLACPRCGGALAFRPNPRAGATADARRAGRPPEPPGGEPPPAPAPATEPRAPPAAGGPPPVRLGPYLLTRELGRGAGGVVYAARRSGRREGFAVKVLDLHSDPEGLARFRLEAELAGRLRHPGIVPVLDAGCAAGRYYYAMELCPGETLRDLLARDGARPAPEAGRLAAALARAVAAAHAQGVLHRDLKPANVLLDPRTRAPRVTDFGLARDLGGAQGLTRTGALLGTPAYMAPEQLEGEAVDARADVYAIGVILYECLSGRRPFEAPTVLALLGRIAAGDPAPPSRHRRVPPALERVCMRALARRPDDRFAGAADLEAALGEAAGGCG